MIMMRVFFKHPAIERKEVTDLDGNWESEKRSVPTKENTKFRKSKHGGHPIDKGGLARTIFSTKMRLGQILYNFNLALI
jgi:hypothetical protein